MLRSLLRPKLVLGLAGAAGTATGVYMYNNPVAAKVAFSPTEAREFKLLESVHITYDTTQYRFVLDSPDDEMGLSVASCIVVGVPDPENPNETVWRPYTPVSRNEHKGYFDLAVKKYPNGKVGTHLDRMRIGDKIKVKGPYKKFDYKPNTKKRIGMVAGGTGITPMLQVITEILYNPNDNTEIDLVFANRNIQEICFKSTLTELEARYPNRLRTHYMLETWPLSISFWVTFIGSWGRPNPTVLKKHLPPPSDDNLILVCGPPPMMKAVSGDKKSPKDQGPLSGMLKDLGYSDNQVFKF